jgi:hypothetical protein
MPDTYRPSMPSLPVTTRPEEPPPWPSNLEQLLRQAIFVTGRCPARPARSGASW